MYDTIIFDLDGTLLNTLEDLCNSVNYALEFNGYTCRTLEEIRCFVGNGVRKLIERALPEGVGEAEFNKIFMDFKEHYKIHCNDFTGPYEGIMELLEELHSRGYKMGIASAGYEKGNALDLVKYSALELRYQVKTVFLSLKYFVAKYFLS